MGTSEIYRAVLGIDEIVDALVVDVPSAGAGGDSWMPLFVVLREGAVLDGALTGEIAEAGGECSPRLRTERRVRHRRGASDALGQAARGAGEGILMGTPVEKAASRDSLQNPAALDQFELGAGAVSAAPTGKSRRVIDAERSGGSLWTATGPSLGSPHSTATEGSTWPFSVVGSLGRRPRCCWPARDSASA